MQGRLLDEGADYAARQQSHRIIFVLVQCMSPLLALGVSRCGA